MCVLVHVHTHQGTCVAVRGQLVGFRYSFHHVCSRDCKAMSLATLEGFFCVCIFSLICFLMYVVYVYACVILYSSIAGS